MKRNSSSLSAQKPTTELYPVQILRTNLSKTHINIIFISKAQYHAHLCEQAFSFCTTVSQFIYF